MIQLDNYITEIHSGASDIVFIHMEKSYCNINTVSKNVYIPTYGSDPKISKKTGNRHILIIIHDIGEDDPLVEIYVEAGYPLDNLAYKGDTCHPEKRDDEQLTNNSL